TRHIRCEEPSSGWLLRPEFVHSRTIDSASINDIPDQFPLVPAWPPKKAPKNHLLEQQKTVSTFVRASLAPKRRVVLTIPLNLSLLWSKLFGSLVRGGL